MKIGTDAVMGPGAASVGLDRIVKAVDMKIPIQDVEWSGEAARLFALDCALVTMRRLLPWLTDAEATLIGIRLNEARRLAVAGREIELGFVSDELVEMLTSSRNHRSRHVWLVALEAMLPDPFRAARIACESAVLVGNENLDGGHPSIESRLRERFAARINEAAMTPAIGPITQRVGLVGA